MSKRWCRPWTQHEYKGPTYSSMPAKCWVMCSFMEFVSMSGPYAALRDVTCRATVSRKSAGGTVAFFIVTRSPTTSRHAHKDVTHAVQCPLSSEGSAEQTGTEAEAASGAEAEAACGAEIVGQQTPLRVGLHGEVRIRMAQPKTNAQVPELLP